jgi:hypothetical protein
MIEAHEAQDKATDAADAAASHLRNHRELLRKRSLRDETIVAAGLSSEDHPVYGLSLAIPFVGHDGNLVQYWDGSAWQPYCQYRPDTPRTGKDGKAVKYLLPKGAPLHVYIPPTALTLLADQTGPLFITEGALKALAIAQLGFAAVGLLGVWGWCKKRPRDENDRGIGPYIVLDDLHPFLHQARVVYIVFDSDIAAKPPVLRAESELANVLGGVYGCTVRRVRLPQPLPGEGEKLGVDDLLARPDGETIFRQCLAEAVQAATMLSEIESLTVPEPAPWPVLADEAYYGLAGEFVNQSKESTEADPVALLGQLHAYFGNAVGRGPHFKVEGDAHYANQFLCLVGDSSRARKGTSRSRITQFMEYADLDWCKACITGGLSSGEGLIWHVRDKVERNEPIKEKGRVTGYQMVVADEGVADKRLLIIESEFAQVLRILQREGNSLSPVLRQAWDSGTLRTLTKNSPVRATGAHVSLIGHITAPELLRYLQFTEMFNGFANRFLWLLCRRARLLPEGGPALDLSPLGQRIKAALEKARSIEAMTRSKAAGELWRAVYPQLTDERPGLYGAVTGRAEAQALRFSMAYALENGSAVIEEAHLKAALAFWAYADASAKHIFSAEPIEPLPERILERIQQAPNGLTRNQLRDAFSRNISSNELLAALAKLRDRGQIYAEEDRDTGGRPAERWRLRGNAVTRKEESTAETEAPQPDPEQSAAGAEVEDTALTRYRVLSESQEAATEKAVAGDAGDDTALPRYRVTPERTYSEKENSSNEGGQVETALSRFPVEPETKKADSEKESLHTTHIPHIPGKPRSGEPSADPESQRGNAITRKVQSPMGVEAGIPVAPPPERPAGVASPSESLRARLTAIKQKQQLAAANAPKARKGVKVPTMATVSEPICAADPAIPAPQTKPFSTPTDPEMEVF